MEFKKIMLTLVSSTVLETLVITLIYIVEPVHEEECLFQVYILTFFFVLCLSMFDLRLLQITAKPVK